MVKVKQSILSRIFRREGDKDAAWPSRGGAISRRGGSRVPASPPVRKPVEPAEEEVVEAPALAAAEVASKTAKDAGKVLATAMDREEEMNVALRRGFDGISDALDGIDKKIEKNQKASDEIMISVRKLPEVLSAAPEGSQAGIELLSRISAVLENQGKTTRELLDRMNQVPQAMSALQDQLGQQVAEIAQGHKNVDRTMHETQRQLSNAFSEIKRTVDGVATDQSRKQEQVISEMRSQQRRQDQRVEELLQRSNGAMRLVVFLMVLAIAALLLVVNQVSS